MALRLPSFENLPRFLYKYRSLASPAIDFTKQIISKCELYFASPLQMNDPFEGYFTFDREDLFGMLPEIAGEVRKQVGQPDVDVKRVADKWPSVAEEYRLSIRGQFLSAVGVVSLTERWDSALMWSHYSDSHRGICIEFDVQLAPRDETWALWPVVYTDYCPVGKLSSADTLGEVMVASMYHKAVDWAYEKEWRFIRLTGEAANPNLPCDLGPAKFPNEMLSGIIFGADTTEPHFNEILSLARELDHPVRIGKAGYDPFAYRVRVGELGDTRSARWTEARPWRGIVTT